MQGVESSYRYDGGYCADCNSFVTAVAVATIKTTIFVISYAFLCVLRVLRASVLGGDKS